MKFPLSNTVKCGEHISMVNGTSLEVYGQNKNPLLNLEYCQWHINIKSARAQLIFEDFNFDPLKTSCGESLITLRNSTSHVFHYCSFISPTAGVEVHGNNFVLDVVRQGWQPNNGFRVKLIFK